MGKSPGFWFFTGDWLKDSELRFCSIFARGLLVDLLCILFEAKEQGYASKPDGTPRSDEEIVSAVSGGSVQEKLAALAELEKSGVLSRDSRGVLFSRRLSRLSDVSKTRSKAGSKGGSKTQAKAKQNGKQNDKQNRGVSDSDSVSDTSNTHTHTADELEVLSTIPDWLAADWDRLQNHLFATTGRRVDPIRAETMAMSLIRSGKEKALADIEFTILKGGKSILDSSNDFEKRTQQRVNKPVKEVSF
jgi:hypothetical protein